MTLVFVSFMFAAILGALLALIIGWAANVFAVETDIRIEQLCDILNGGNCGACSAAGCTDFAKKMVEGSVLPSQCPMASEDEIRRMADILGIQPRTVERKVAVVYCSGDKTHTVRSLYNGISDCNSAALVAGGAKGCDYGCIGFGSCAKACPFDAIEIRDGLAVVHPERCVGCGKCVDTCPKNLIRLVPASVDVHIYCNSPEKGALKRKVCQTACIGCRKCVKAADNEEQVQIKGFLLEINYDNPPPPDLVEKTGCPTSALRLASEHAAGKYKGISK